MSFGVPQSGGSILWEQTRCQVVNTSLRGAEKEGNTSLEPWQHLNPVASLSCSAVTVLVYIYIYTSIYSIIQFTSVQSLSRVRLFATP